MMASESPTPFLPPKTPFEITTKFSSDTCPASAANNGVAIGISRLPKLISISLCEKSLRSINTTFAISLLLYFQNHIGFAH